MHWTLADSCTATNRVSQIIDVFVYNLFKLVTFLLFSSFFPFVVSLSFHVQCWIEPGLTPSKVQWREYYDTFWHNQHLIFIEECSTFEPWHVGSIHELIEFYLHTPNAWSMQRQRQRQRQRETSNWLHWTECDYYNQRLTFLLNQSFSPHRALKLTTRTHDYTLCGILGILLSNFNTKTMNQHLL